MIKTIEQYKKLSFTEIEQGKRFLDAAKADKDSDTVRSCIQHIGTQMSLHHTYTLQELCTGFGKTKTALDVANEIGGTWLIVHRMLTHKNNIQHEIAKWKKAIPGYLRGVRFVFTTYVGIKKFKECNFDGVIADEAHNFTEASLNILASIERNKTVLLTASLPPEKRKLIMQYFQFQTLRVTLQEAQVWGVLPTIKFIVVPIYQHQCKPKDLLEILDVEQEIKKAFSLKIKLERERKSSDWVLQTKILPLGASRKRLFSKVKASVIFTKTMEEFIKNYRTIFFLDNIDQAEGLPFQTVHSKMSKDEVLTCVENFNKMRFNVLTAINMLNESMNLFKLQIGFLLSLGRSNEVANIQRTGRMTRSDNPVMVLPYLVGTSDEKLVLSFANTMTDVEVIDVQSITNRLNELMNENQLGSKRAD